MISELHRVLKITTTRTFSVGHPDEIASHPLATDTAPNLENLRKWLPQFADRPMKSWVCPWVPTLEPMCMANVLRDLMTVDQRAIIDKAEGTDNLIIASAGNYHSAKFLPNFGRLVVRRLKESISDGSDQLSDELLKGCKWERLEGAVPIHAGVVPKPG